LDLYFEAIDPKTGKPSYTVLSDPVSDTLFLQYHVMKSHRVWQETADRIVYIKNRYSDPNITPVDITEFIWVKLSAQSI
jgi:hypothetical protein